MKAVVYRKYGPPEVLQLVDIDKPDPKSNEVLIRVYATTLNRTDTGFRSAKYFVSRIITGLVKPKKIVTGTEFAGEIVSIGADVKDYQVGDKVFGFDDSQFGAHAEFKTEPSNGPMAKVPVGFDYYDIAPAGEGATYALNIIKAAGVKKGTKVLVYGASGAIGSAAVQICKYLGAEVMAVCGTKNVKLVKSLGADTVVDYQTEDFADTAQRFDMIFDAVGKSSYGVCKRLMRPNGIYVSTELGSWGQNVFLALWFGVTGSRKVIFPIPKINRENVDYIKHLLESGAYKPVIDRQYALDEIVEASKYAESGQKTGNIVVRVI